MGVPKRGTAGRGAESEVLSFAPEDAEMREKVLEKLGLAEQNWTSPSDVVEERLLRCQMQAEEAEEIDAEKDSTVGKH